MKQINKRTVCPDGFSISIQANEYAYCEPRQDFGPYTEVELGYPSDIPPDYILKYSENDDDYTQTIYAYVPLELVIKMLAEHGLEEFEIK